LFVDVVAGQAAALFAEQAVAVPDEVGGAEAVGFADSSAEGVVGVADGLVEAGFLDVGFDELVSSKWVSLSCCYRVGGFLFQSRTKFTKSSVSSISIIWLIFFGSLLFGSQSAPTFL